MLRKNQLRRERVYDPLLESDRQRSLRIMTHVLYGLYALFLLTGGISIIAAIIVNYVKRADTIGTLYESHFRWQIRTFWCALAGGALGVALFLIGGVVVLWATSIWMLYRIIKGWLYLYEGRPLPLRARA